MFIGRIMSPGFDAPLTGHPMDGEYAFALAEELSSTTAEAIVRLDHVRQRVIRDADGEDRLFRCREARKIRKRAASSPPRVAHHGSIIFRFQPPSDRLRGRQPEQVLLRVDSSKLIRHVPERRLHFRELLHPGDFPFRHGARHRRILCHEFLDGLFALRKRRSCAANDFLEVRLESRQIDEPSSRIPLLAFDEMEE
jgi:hypothetical protein